MVTIENALVSGLEDDTTVTSMQPLASLRKGGGVQGKHIEGIEHEGAGDNEQGRDDVASNKKDEDDSNHPWVLGKEIPLGPLQDVLCQA